MTDVNLRGPGSKPFSRAKPRCCKAAVRPEDYFHLLPIGHFRFFFAHQARGGPLGVYVPLMNPGYQSGLPSQRAYPTFSRVLSLTEERVLGQAYHFLGFLLIPSGRKELQVKFV